MPSQGLLLVEDRIRFRSRLPRKPDDSRILPQGYWPVESLDCDLRVSEELSSDFTLSRFWTSLCGNRFHSSAEYLIGHAFLRRLDLTPGFVALRGLATLRLLAS